MSKVRGFTIIEMVIVMLVSSIVIAIAMTSYELFFKKYMRYRASGEALQKLVRFHRELSGDIRRAQMVKKQGNTLEFIRKNEQAIHYTFRDSLVVREQQESRSAYPFAAREVKGLFQGKKMPASGIIDEIRFYIRYKDEVFPFYFQKQYSAATLMQLSEQQNF